MTQFTGIPLKMAEFTSILLTIIARKTGIPENLFYKYTGNNIARKSGIPESLFYRYNVK